MSKPRSLIGLDLDGVLYRWTEAALATVHALRGREVPEYGEDQHWNHIKEVLSPEEWKWLWSDPEARQYCFATGRAYADGVRAAVALERRGDVVIVTSRPADTNHVTAAWLARHGVPYHALVVVPGPGEKHLHPFVGLCDIFVDDNPDNARNIAELGVPVYVPARDYNEEVQGEPGIIRFTDWEEVTNG